MIKGALRYRMRGVKMLGCPKGYAAVCRRDCFPSPAMRRVFGPAPLSAPWTPVLRAQQFAEWRRRHLWLEYGERV